ncbi:hypothetical protein [Nocardia farcinica]|uniref:hypothetical protein n=1 Tax=Nocardia farcinica TaxID=37329 RepID=UPI002457ADCD|nr:hypothetical protein [Nocardia farcinica]
MGFDDKFSELQAATQRQSDEASRRLDAQAALVDRHGAAVVVEIRSSLRSAVQHLMKAGVKPVPVVSYNPTPFFYAGIQADAYRRSRVVAHAWAKFDGLCLTDSGVLFQSEPDSPSNMRLTSGRGERLTKEGQRHQKQRDRMLRRLHLSDQYPLYIHEHHLGLIDEPLAFNDLIGIPDGDWHDNCLLGVSPDTLAKRLAPNGLGRSGFGVLPDGRPAFVRVDKIYDEGPYIAAVPFDSWLAGIVHKLVQRAG